MKSRGELQPRSASPRARPHNSNGRNNWNGACRTEADPPFACEAETGVLGCVLLNSDFCLPILGRAAIGPRHFYDQRHAAILLAAQELQVEGLPVDDHLLLPRFKAKGIEMDWNYLQSLRDSVPSAMNLEYYLPDLKEAFLRRELIQRAHFTRAIAEDQTKNLRTLEDTAEQFYSVLRQASGTNHLPPILPAPKFLAEDLPDSPEVIGGLLHQGSKLVLSGASKSRKTFLLADLAVSVASGANWLGMPTSKGRVLYLNSELSARTFQKRLRSIADAKGISTENLIDLNLWNLRGKTSAWNVLIPQIRANVKDEAYILIIIDPLYKIYGSLKENAAEDMAVLTNALGELAEESGAALAIATHHSKGNQSSKEAIDRISGSGVIARDADALVDFTANEIEDAFSVSLRLRDFKPMADFGVRWHFPLFRRDEDIDPAKLKLNTGRKTQVDPLKALAAIRDRTTQNPISVSEWAKLAGIARQTLADHVETFRLKGWIQTIGEGSKARKCITLKGLSFLAEKEGQND